MGTKNWNRLDQDQSKKKEEVAGNDRLHARSPPVWVNILILLAPFLIVAATIELELDGDLNLVCVA
jgi:hypothetical protein